MISRTLAAASLKPVILAIFAHGPSYGYEIIQRVHDLTEGDVRWTTGTLYPLLHALENKGLLVGFWRDAGPGPRRKYYRLTRAGRRVLEIEKRQWMRMNDVLTTLWEQAPSMTGT